MSKSPTAADIHHHGEIDAATGTATTGHEWDGIKELNTPLPSWWLWVLYATHVWALVYVVLYPAIPFVGNGASNGLLGWNSRAAVVEDIAAADAKRAGVLQQIKDLPLEEIAKNDELRRAAFRAGQSAFKVNCVQCHGADAAGSPGYANLNDDDWLWGGTLDDIHTTLEHGIRYAPDAQTRVSQMPAFGRDKVLDKDQIAQVAAYVLSLSGQKHDAALAAKGAEAYATNCASCHGEKGEGVRDLGGPRLNDAVWLFSARPEQVAAQISNPNHGVMPGWAGRLDAVTIKQLAIYVHGLGGGQAAAK